MEPCVVSIFEEAEKYFRTKIVDQSASIIDSKEVVSNLLKNCTVLANFTKVRNSCNQQIGKELGAQASARPPHFVYSGSYIQLCETKA